MPETVDAAKRGKAGACRVFTHKGKREKAKAKHRKHKPKKKLHAKKRGKVAGKVVSVKVTPKSAKVRAVKQRHSAKACGRAKKKA